MSQRDGHSSPRTEESRLSTLSAWLFDLDGVITDTAALHAQAWKQLFDEYLAANADPDGAFEPFRLPEDYVAYVDGKPRQDGVRSFLESRKISLPEGSPSDDPGAPTIQGLGRRKDGYFNAALNDEGVTVFEGTIALIRELRAKGIRIGCVSSSKNCRPILDRAGIRALFDVVVDGTDIEREGLSGKPRPDSFLRAAEQLAIAPSEAAVVEDAVSGVAAGQAGAFALVIGIDRGAGRDALLAHGADSVVDDMREFLGERPVNRPE